MNFISWEFGVFLAVVLVLFHVVPARMRMGVLLAASYVFYATWSWRFIGLILSLTIVVFLVGRSIDKNRFDESKKRFALIIGILVSVLVLVVFKYLGFLAQVAQDLSDVFGLPNGWFILQIALPLGISFYTFEAISYMVDVYRGMTGARNIIRYNFYIMYFPHLISGPIIRYEELMGQHPGGIAAASVDRIYEGVKLITLGLLFKAVISDPAAGIADQIFAEPLSATSQAAWIGALAFTVQIYFDFMGYTHIARGASLLFNIQLPLNFNHPYSAASPQDFWRRWHISLSRWIRDYLYIPLSGSRGTLRQTCLNLLFVMSLAGLWHGAGWTYLLWGSYHGALLVLNHLWRASPAGSASDFLWRFVPYRVLCVGGTFVLVVSGWVLFRAPDLHSALALLSQMSNVSAAMQGFAHDVLMGDYSTLAVLFTCLLLCFVGPAAEKTLEGIGRRLPLWMMSSLVTLVLAITVIAASDEQKPFIYFQF